MVDGWKLKYWIKRLEHKYAKVSPKFQDLFSDVIGIPTFVRFDRSKAGDPNGQSEPML